VQPLHWVGPDHLANADYVLRIQRGSQGMITSLAYSNERVRGLRYDGQPQAAALCYAAGRTTAIDYPTRYYKQRDSIPRSRLSPDEQRETASSN
jgi:hypothetical protein